MGTSTCPNPNSTNTGSKIRPPRRTTQSPKAQAPTCKVKPRSSTTHMLNSRSELRASIKTLSSPALNSRIQPTSSTRRNLNSKSPSSRRQAPNSELHAPGFRDPTSESKIQKSNLQFQVRRCHLHVEVSGLEQQQSEAQHQKAQCKTPPSDCQNPPSKGRAPESQIQHTNCPHSGWAVGAVTPKGDLG